MKCGIKTYKLKKLRSLEDITILMAPLIKDSHFAVEFQGVDMLTLKPLGRLIRICDKSWGGYSHNSAS